MNDHKGSRFEHTKNRLIARRLELLARGAVADRQSQTEPDGSRERTEAQIAEDVEVLSVLKDARLEELAAVNAALARIAEGSYGICERCGRAIDANRLAAMPETAYCVKCAAMADA